MFSSRILLLHHSCSLVSQPSLLPEVWPLPHRSINCGAVHKLGQDTATLPALIEPMAKQGFFFFLNLFIIFKYIVFHALLKY